MEERAILNEQMAYYRARAHEYDEWFLRQGRYDRGPEHRDQWLGEAAEIEAELLSAIHGVEVLELACGTGLWTQRLAENNKHVTAVDASPDVAKALSGEDRGVPSCGGDKRIRLSSTMVWSMPSHGPPTPR